MKSQDNYPLLKTLSQGGESQIIEDQHLVRDPLNKKVQEQKRATRSGTIGLAHQYPMGGIAPGGGGGTPPPGRGGPPE